MNNEIRFSYFLAGVLAILAFLLVLKYGGINFDKYSEEVDTSVESSEPETKEGETSEPIVETMITYQSGPATSADPETLIEETEVPETINYNDWDYTSTSEWLFDPKTVSLSSLKTDGYYCYPSTVLPLTREQQRIATNIANEYKLPVELLYGIMRTETYYQTQLISPTQDYGIMQINVYNHDWLRRALGVSDFLDFEQNVRCGAYILTYYTGTYENVAQILMCYNLGEGGAQAAWKKGDTFNSYCEKVITEINRLLSYRLSNS